MTSLGCWEWQPAVNIDTSVITDLWESSVCSFLPLHVYAWFFNIACALTCDLRGLAIRFVSFCSGVFYHLEESLETSAQENSEVGAGSLCGTKMPLNICTFTTLPWLFETRFAFSNILQMFKPFKTHHLNTQHALLTIVWDEANTADEWDLPVLQALCGTFWD